MNSKSQLMQRCFDLARLGAGYASPNPMVGAVVAYKGKIIGEGYFAKDGGPHAEVMAIESVKEEDRKLLSESTLYVSLEPCNIYGRTPPCTKLILETGIPKVVVAARDLTPGVNGAGIERLRQQGVEVEEVEQSEQGDLLSKYRNTFVAQKRPYVLLKYAQTENGFLAPEDGRTQWLTNEYSKRLVHKWRTETDAILVGSGTAKADNPALTARMFPGPQARRIVIDRKGDLPTDLKLFNGEAPTLVFTQENRIPKPDCELIEHNFEQTNWLAAMLSILAEKRIAHLTVEGGAWVLQQFVQNGFWDEARVFVTDSNWGAGLRAPDLAKKASKSFFLQKDLLRIYYAFQVSSD